MLVSLVVVFQPVVFAFGGAERAPSVMELIHSSSRVAVPPQPENLKLHARWLSSCAFKKEAILKCLCS